MAKRKPVTDHEIESYMDFNEILTRAAAPTRGPLTNNRGILWSATGLLVTLGCLLWLTTQKSQQAIDDLKNSGVTTIADTLSTHQPGFTAAPEKERVPSFDPVPEPSTELMKADELPSDKQPGLQYQKAIPIQGYPNLYEYFDRELRYPATALADSVQGTTPVTFVLNTSGKPIDVTIVNSLGPEFDLEVMRLIENMPAWHPARLNGKAVRSRISLPITFQINKP